MVIMNLRNFGHNMKKKKEKTKTWLVTKSIKLDPAKLQKAKEMGVSHLLAPKMREYLDQLIADKRKK